MTVVLDTSVLLPLFGKAGRHRPLRDAIARGRVRWAVSTSVLFEYEEILVARSGRSRWEALLRFMHAVSLRHGSIMRVSPSFCFRIVTADPDDNKFTDCAITAHAGYVITEDAHFKPLTDAGCKPQPITPAGIHPPAFDRELIAQVGAWLARGKGQRTSPCRSWREGFPLRRNLPRRSALLPSLPLSHIEALGGSPQDGAVWEYAKTGFLTSYQAHDPLAEENAYFAGGSSLSTQVCSASSCAGDRVSTGTSTRSVR